MAQRGRPPGSPNKSTATVKALAQKHGPQAIAELARLASAAASEQARVAAIKELLDRAYGKSAPSPEEREDTKALVVQLVKYRA
jgi:hypothetical protein